MDKLSLQLWSTKEPLKTISVQLVKDYSGLVPSKESTGFKNWSLIKIRWLWFVFSYSWVS